MKVVLISKAQNPVSAFEIRDTGILCISVWICDASFYVYKYEEFDKNDDNFPTVECKRTIEVHIEWCDDRNGMDKYVRNLKIQSKNKNNYESEEKPLWK